MSKRLLLSRILERFYLRHIMAPYTSPSFIVVNYHRIYSTPSVETEFDSDVFGHSAKSFEQHVSWLSKNCNVLSESDLISAMKDGFPVGKPNVLITFDDGYIDNFEIAVPILQKYGVSATFFVPYLSIENREVGWWDLAAWCLKKTEKTSLTIAGESLLLDSRASTYLATRAVHGIFKKKKHEETGGLIKQLSIATGVALPDETVQSQELMSWSQLRQMIELGMSIGSHTMSHRVLSRIENKDQDWEIIESKSKISERLETDVRSIAYPVGKRDSINAYSLEASEKAGYDLAFSFYSGFYKGDMPNRFDIKRVCLSEEDPLYISEMVAPKIFLP